MTLTKDSGRLLDFDYTDEDIVSLRKQMRHPVSSVTVATTSSLTNSSPSISFLCMIIQSGLIFSLGQHPRSVAESPDSSVLSDLPPKKRRASSSSLSDDHDNSSDDEEENKPLAARMIRGTRSVPGKRTGKQPPGKKSKQSSGQVNGAETTSNGRVNGINRHPPKVKTEEKMNEGQLNRLTAGVPVDAIGRSFTAVGS
jgi:histone acetyltransferase